MKKKLTNYILLTVSVLAVSTPAILSTQDVQADTITASVKALNRSTKNSYSLTPIVSSKYKQAVKSAKSFVKYSAFSKKKLIRQLKSAGYTTKQAEYGATHASINWNTQAVRKAKSYMRFRGMSKKRLKTLLTKYEFYTAKQADYAIKKVFKK